MVPWCHCGALDLHGGSLLSDFHGAVFSFDSDSVFFLSDFQSTSAEDAHCFSPEDLEFHEASLVLSQLLFSLAELAVPSNIATAAVLFLRNFR